MRRLLTVLLLALALAAPLSACGKKGSPKPPDRDTVFPKQYPKG